MSTMAATKGLIDHLLLAACEWFLMFWVFIDAALAYSLTKFARYCDLQIPCLLCSRLDHFFDKEEPGSYFHLFCDNHQADISYLIYCNLHNELVDIREICEDCLHSQSNLECYRFVVDKNLTCMGSSIRTCSCCKRQWKEKPSGQTMIDPHMVGSRGCNVTTKPPLPRVTRPRVRARHGDGVRKMRNKTRNRRKYGLSPGAYSDANVTSDSEFEFLFSDDDDGSFRDHPIMRSTTTRDYQNKILGRHSYSTPDLGSLLESQLNQGVRTRSTSVTPNVARSLRRTEDNNHVKPRKHMHPSSSASSASSMVFNSSGIQPQNPCKLSSRHSYSACDLGSALFLEMQLNSLPRRSASVTPNSNYASGHGFGEFKWPKCQTQPASSNDTAQNYLQKAKRSRKSTSKTNSMRRSGSYGHLDDSSISCNTATQNQNKIPRRHSYSVFQLGCEILLNMPTDEPLTSNSSSFQQSNSFGYGFQDPNSRPGLSNSHSRELDSLNAMLSSMQRPNSNGYGYFDDSFVARNTGNQYHDHNTIPRRHSYSFFEMGCEILLNMPNEESIAASRPEPMKPNPNQFPNKKAKKAKKNPSPYLHKSEGPSSWDDSVIAHNTGNQIGNRDRRRHSYSAFELGCALLFEMQKDESLTRRSTSVTPNPQIVHGLGEQNKTKFQNRPNNSRSHNPFLDKNHGNGYFDDSVVPRNKGNHGGQVALPRRHSYSVFQLGGDILLNMPHDESLINQSSFMATNESISHGYGESQTSIFHIKHSPCHSPEHKSHHPHPLHHNGVPLPTMGHHVKRFNSSSDAGHDFSNAYVDKNKWHGSMDDSVVYRSMNSQNQNNVPRRHSYSAFDLGRALLVEMQLDESLKRSYAPPAANVASGHGLGEFHQPNFQNKHNPSSSERKHNMPWPKSDVHGSRDDSFMSHNTGNHTLNHNVNQNQNENPRRHSFSALELGCAVLLDMHNENMKRRRSASVTPSAIGHHFEDPRNSKGQTRPGPLPQQAHPVNSFGSSSASLYNNNNNRHHGSMDDSAVSHGRGSRKRYRNLVRNSYSVSDLTSPSFEMRMEESFVSKSASLTPNCSIGQGLGELDWLKFQTGTSSRSQELDSNQMSHKKRKKGDRAKGKKGKKALQSANNGGGDSSMDNTNWYDSSDDPAFSNDTGSRNRYAMFSRNSQSVNDLGSVLLEMHLDDSVRSRSKSLTPNSSIGYGSQEEKWSKSQIKPSPSHSPEHQFHSEKPRRHDHPETERDKKHLPPLIPTKDTDSSSNIIRQDSCSMCSERMDARSLDGSTYTEMEVDGIVETVKRKAEDDVRCMRLLQSELEAERNAATVAANHAMNMITRLQQEKASLQMEALQYLRMMEEQAEYDMEALQKANELVEEKENEIQDLLDELEQYRIKYGDISMGNIHVPVIIFENEKRYILESLSTLEKKLQQLSDGDHLNDDNSFLTPKDSAVSNGAFDKCQEFDSATMEHELLELKEKIEGLQADIELVKHACNTLHGSEGMEFIQEITHQLQDLRRMMVDKRCISSN